ncbi:MAG: response regulator [Planctomycetia bacterium]|nr:response regulator [Planctomycetia bacterium]
MAKILIVEDNEENWDVLSRRLRRRGFDVALAHDGVQGVAAALAESPDLILMDMNMPLVDGWEATRQIRANPATRAIPVIALTAHGMDGDRERAIEAGCDDHHAKPFELPRLLAQIDALLTRGAAG